MSAEPTVRRETPTPSFWRPAGWALAMIVVAVVVLPQFGQLSTTVRAASDASLAWVAVAVLFSAGSYAASTATLVAATPIRLGAAATLAAQFAGTFANLVAPSGLGAIGVNERFLERAGLRRSCAISTVALVAVASVVLHVVALSLVAAWLGRTVELHFRLPGHWPIVMICAAALTLVGLGAAVLRGRERLVDGLRSGRAAVLTIAARPWRITALAVSQLGVTGCYCAALGASIYAFGSAPAFATIAFVYLGGSALAAASPTPAGLGVAEAALVAGLTLGGVASGPAIAGVLTFRLVTYWLPAFVGAITLRSLLRRHLL